MYDGRCLIYFFLSASVVELAFVIVLKVDRVVSYRSYEIFNRRIGGGFFVKGLIVCLFVRSGACI